MARVSVRVAKDDCNVRYLDTSAKQSKFGDEQDFKTVKLQRRQKTNVWKKENFRILNLFEHNRIIV